MSTGSIIIKRGREKPIVNQHPWIFSGAIERVEGNPTPGDIVTVKSQDGKFLARGYWNPKSQIQVRILTWQDEPIDEGWWRRMLRRAMDGRRQGAPRLPGLCRLINAENDYLPGLIVDRYGGWLVLQALTLGIDTRKSMISDLLFAVTSNRDDVFGIYERSDVDVRHKEGLDFRSGRLVGQEPPEYILIHKFEREILIDVRRGHKTGYYLDQEHNREEAGYIIWSLPQNSRVLNLFSYTGTFVLSSLERENVDQFINVDASREALELAETIVSRNKPDWLKKR